MSPRILVIDIETMAAKVYSFGPFGYKPVFVGIDQIIEPDRMICFAAQWLDEKQTMFYSEWEHGPEAMFQAAFDLLDEADAIVHYNGSTFDEPWLNRVFLEQGLGQPSDYQTVDIYKAGKKHFRFLSHKLQYLLVSLEVGSKTPHEGFALWRKVDEGDEKAQKRMERYCRNDTRKTKELTLFLLQWLDKMPNQGLFVDSDVPVCPRCGSADIQKRGFKATNVSVFQQYQCKDCKSWSRSGKREKGVDIR